MMEFRLQLIRDFEQLKQGISQTIVRAKYYNDWQRPLKHNI
jgi:hypothetical protein